MNPLFLLIYFILIRTFLHLSLTAVIYHIICQFTEMTKVYFLFVIFPFALVTEYYQYKHNVVDSINKVALVRDLISILLILIFTFFLYYFQTSFSYQNKTIMIFILMMLILLLNIIMEPYKPAGQHYVYKHIIDVAAYILGPFIIYPFMIKYLF